METQINRRVPALLTLLLLLCLATGQAAWAVHDIPSASSAEEVVNSHERFSREELQDLLAPIALYPDPLIAQILPAATFIHQINEAARYVGQEGKYARIDSQDWDVSVKAVAHYPDLLFMMDREYDWTVSLGQAFINQREEVMQAVQLLRRDAFDTGNLVSTPQQQVVVEGGYIRILPAQPDLIYLPEYDPQEVYVEPSQPGFGLLTFGIGFTIGPWLNRDCDWHGHRVYYHGWRGHGWIERSRPHIHTRNSAYVNSHQTRIHTDNRILRHDIEYYRGQVRQDARRRQERHKHPGHGKQPVERGQQKLEGRPVPGGTPPAAPPQQHPSRDRRQKLEGRPILPATGQPPQGGVPRPPPEKRQPQGGTAVPVIREQPGPNRPGHDQQPHGRDATVHHERGRESQEGMRQSGHPVVPAQPRQPPAQRQPEVRKQPAAAQQSRPALSTPVQRPQVEQRPVTTGTTDTTPRPAGQPASRQSPGSTRSR